MPDGQKRPLLLLHRGVRDELSRPLASGRCPKAVGGGLRTGRSGGQVVETVVRGGDLLTLNAQP